MQPSRGECVNQAIENPNANKKNIIINLKKPNKMQLKIKRVNKDEWIELTIAELQTLKN